MLNTSLCGRLFNFVRFQNMLVEKIWNSLKLPVLVTFKDSTAKVQFDGMFKMQFENLTIFEMVPKKVLWPIWVHLTPFSPQIHIRLETYPKSKRFSVSDPPFLAVLGGVWCGDIFFNFGQIDMIKKIKMFYRTFWLRKKFLGQYRIFYERRNFYENWNFVIFA